MAFMISAATTIPTELAKQSDAMAALDAALYLRERGCRRIKITDTQNGKTFSPAEFSVAVGTSAQKSQKSG